MEKTQSYDAHTYRIYERVCVWTKAYWMLRN